MAAGIWTALACNPSIGIALASAVGSLGGVAASFVLRSACIRSASIISDGLKNIGTADGSGLYHMERGLTKGSENIAEAIEHCWREGKKAIEA